jgi:hypothetical protein
MCPALSTPRAEVGLGAAVAALLLLALALPHLTLPEHYHHFADQRTLAGLPCAADVLSNLAFALVGVAGLRALRGACWRTPWVALAGLLCAGLLVTAAGSSVYHLAPGDAGLVLDRAAMALPFAGLLGLVAALRVSDRAGLALAVCTGLAASAALLVSRHTGDHGPWTVLQAGGVLLLVALALRATRPGLPVVAIAPVLLLYALAKALELGDHTVWAWSGGWISGHTLKHLAAAGAVWPVVVALRRVPGRPSPRSGQNVHSPAAPDHRPA